MDASKVIRIAVASDLHAYSDNSSSPSHLNIAQAESAFQHPISALLNLIQKDQLKANILLSPGDLGNMADAKGIAYSWSALGKISNALDCSFYTATAGNHDIDSRRIETEHNPLHILKGLVPSFPFQDDGLDDKYWSRAYAIKDIPPTRIVVLNSSSFHGYGDIEQNHGRVDDQTLLKLDRDLRTSGTQPINILLCHHHPHQHSELTLGETDVMRHGQQLLDLLGTGKYGRWLVIHGHKHHPKIAYAAGGSVSPTVFAAGSLCAIFTGPLQTSARNQFYIIEIDPADCETYGLVGQVRAWDWSTGNGWIEASATSSGLPARFGFGYREDPLMLAKRISSHILLSADAVPWRDIERAIPEVRFLMPQDLGEVARLLETNYKLALPRNGSNIVEVGRSTT